MRVLYVAPRYHTNQIPIVKGWMENGHQVMFISQFQSTPEDYSILKPIVLGYWKPLEMLIHMMAKLRYHRRYAVGKEYAIKIKVCIPPLHKMKQYVNEFKPDVMILRERSLYNIPFYRFSVKHHIPCILYNQSPIWDKPDRDQGLLHRILIRFLPAKRMSPVLGKEEVGKVRMKNSFYVPFVIEPRIAPEQKTHFAKGKIQILCVGRYEKRKNLFLLIDVIRDLVSRYDLALTIIGEANDDSQQDYYDRLQKRINEYGMTERCCLLKNLSIEEMYHEYEKADLFVLPSTKERASVSQLEAMSCSVPVICSETNGTACYVVNGKNGYVFRDMDSQDLKEKIELVIADQEKLVQMGINSYNEVMEKYRFSNYYNSILNIIDQNRKENRDEGCI